MFFATALYVLPYGNSFFKKQTLTVKYAGTTADDGEETKKDTGKDFVPARIVAAAQKIVCSTPAAPLADRPVMLYCNVITPPPKQA